MSFFSFFKNYYKHLLSANMKVFFPSKPCLANHNTSDIDSVYPTSEVYRIVFLFICMRNYCCVTIVT